MGDWITDLAEQLKARDERRERDRDWALFCERSIKSTRRDIFRQCRESVRRACSKLSLTHSDLSAKAFIVTGKDALAVVVKLKADRIAVSRIGAEVSTSCFRLRCNSAGDVMVHLKDEACSYEIMAEYILGHFLDGVVSVRMRGFNAQNTG